MLTVACQVIADRRPCWASLPLRYAINPSPPAANSSSSPSPRSGSSSPPPNDTISLRALGVNTYRREITIDDPPNMSDNASSPLLRSADRPPSNHSRHSDESHEDTPLLSRSDDTPRYDRAEEDDEGRIPSPAATSLRSLQNGQSSTKSSKGGRRWPTVVAVAVLGLVVLGIIGGAFFAPAVVE